MSDLLTKTVADKPNDIEAIIASLVMRTGTNNGIDIAVVPKEGFNCAEFTTKADYPLPMLIAPWIQFEPSALADLRMRVAMEICRRAIDYPALLKQVEKANGNARNSMDFGLDRQTAWFAIFDLWRAERVKYGLDADFKEWEGKWPRQAYTDWHLTPDQRERIRAILQEPAK